MVVRSAVGLGAWGHGLCHAAYCRVTRRSSTAQAALLEACRPASAELDVWSCSRMWAVNCVRNALHQPCYLVL
jgi:hypothetical protein